MIRNLKSLGLALVAVFALGAMAAQAASAADAFTATNSPATATGESANNVFKLTGPGLEVKCAKSHFAGSFASGATAVTITPTYTGTAAEPTSTHCESTVGKATIDMNGCDYELTGSTTQSDSGSPDAVVWIKCTGSNEIVVTNSLCNLKIPAQTPTTGGVTYTNEANGTVKITATVTGITYTSEGAFCSLGGVSSEANDADYNGTVVAEQAGNTLSVSGS